MTSAKVIQYGDSIRDQALRILRQAIVSGEMRTGELYSATALARNLEVSVSPVREAMLTLVATGLMEPVRNRGYRVAELSQDDLDEIFEIRVFLEVPAIRALAATDISDSQERLNDQVQATEQFAAAQDVTSFLAADREFHLTLLELHGNSRLMNSAADLRDQTRLYGLKTGQVSTLTAAAREHREILNAVLAGDSEAAGDLLATHLNHVRNEWAAP